LDQSIGIDETNAFQLYYYYKMFDYNVKFTGELKLSYSYVALSLKTR